LHITDGEVIKVVDICCIAVEGTVVVVPAGCVEYEAVGLGVETRGTKIDYVK
jgi:hypothetical protein